MAERIDPEVVKKMLDNSLLSPTERAYYSERMEMLKKSITESKTSEYNTVRSLNHADNVREIRRIEKTLRERTIPEITGATKDKLKKRAEYLESVIKSDMPTYDEMWGEKNSDKDAPLKRKVMPHAIEKQINWVKTKQVFVHEWISIMKVLEPGDPRKWDVESLRKPK